MKKKAYITPTIDVLTAKVEKGFQLSSTPVGSSTSYEDALAEPIYGGATIVF